MYTKTGYNAAMPETIIRNENNGIAGSQEPRDWLYWKSRSYEERMAELEKIRQLHYAGRDNVPTRLLGVVKITRRRES
ncbi:hypothetical protein hrd7_09030 [Leptolinea sp. HRD-7]|jgi:hypothetical protein|nr:hypothetical protein hrd7_09030 [Leptolinea sp. HRD-7]